MPNPTKAELLEEVSRLHHRVMELERQQQVKNDHELFDTIPCGILECNTSGVIRFGNSTFANMHGYDQSELRGTSIYELLADETEQARLRNDLACLINGQTSRTSCFTRHRTKGGKTIAVQVDWSCQRDETGNVTSLLAVVTNHSQRETNHSKKIDLAGQYFNLVREMILVVDADETISLINQQGCHMLEADESEILGKNWFDHFLPPSNREKVRTFFRQLIREGAAQQVEYHENEVLTAEGNLKMMAWHFSILRDDQDRIIGILNVAVDLTERQETQRALRENRQLFHQFAENVNDLIWVASPDLQKIFYVNHVYEKFWGRSRESLYADMSTYITAIHPEDQAELQQYVEKKASGDFSNPKSPEFRVIHPDGTMRWLQVRAFPVYDENQQVARVVGLAEDLTQRKQTEAAVLREHEELEQRVKERTAELAQKTTQLKAVFNALPDVMLIINPQGDIINFNSRRRKNMFFSRDLADGRKLWDILPLEISNQIETAIRQVFMTKKMETLDYPLMHQGQQCWYRCRVLPYLSDELLLIIENINEQKLAEIELKDTHEKLSEAQRLAHIGSWEWDLDDDSLWWSNEVLRIFGKASSRFIPTYPAFLETVHPEDRELVERAVAQTLKHDLPYNIEHRIIRPSGEIRYVHEQGALKKNASGEIVGMHGTVQDISEQYETTRISQEYRDILAHASRLAVMGELMAGISHELNQPLTAIANYSSAMKVLIAQGQDIFEMVNRIEELSLRSGNIVRRLKSMAEKRAQELISFNIQESIRSALELIKYEIRKNAVEVNLLSDSKFIIIHADRIQIEQVFANLFLNAIEAMAESVLPRILTITVSSPENHMISVTVSDTGKGVPADFVGQLFTPFATNKKGGLGIGLSLSRSLVEASGGTICYKPNAERGATFHISLPTSQLRN